MLKRVMRIAAAAFALAATGSASRADFVIDNFTTPTNPEQYSLAGAVGATSSRSDALSGGLTRDLLVTQTANQIGNAGATSGVIGGGFFSLSTSANTTAFASLLYSYATPQNLSLSGTAVQFTFDFADLNTPFSVRITDSNGAVDEETRSVSSATTGAFSIDIVDFLVDLSKITSIELLLNRNVNTNGSTTSADLILSEVRITTPNVEEPPPAVPAPPALALLAAALPALGLARRFAFKA